MVIAIYGAGYVGLVSAVCFAKIGHEVICADINEERINLLKTGVCPIYEEHLPELLNEQLKNARLQFTTNLSYAVKEASVHFIATGTPSLADGQADLTQVYAVATKIAQEATAETLLVIKSTVPVGTGDAIQQHVKDELKRVGHAFSIHVASNPEFLREGTAVYDFLNADRIIIGGEKDALAVLRTVYSPLVEQKNIPLLSMERRSAELTKYAANMMLACRISFINEISRIAEKAGANIDEIREGIGTDQRIGLFFLQAGIGYGGSCFPKDGRALIQTAHALGEDVPLLDAIENVNLKQKKWVIEQLIQHFNGNLQDKIIGIWGVAFKPGTDDIREASSLVVIEALIKAGCKLRLYDPVAMPAAKEYLQHHEALTWCHSADDVLDDSLDALVIATEWQIFKDYSLHSLQAALHNAPIIDGRNCFDLAKIREANISYYYSVGRPRVGKEII